MRMTFYSKVNGLPPFVEPTRKIDERVMRARFHIGASGNKYVSMCTCNIYMYTFGARGYKYVYMCRCNIYIYVYTNNKYII